MKLKYLLSLIFIIAASSISPASMAKLKGAYHAPALSGDFKNSGELKNFISQMSARHNFDKNYLNGLFSKAKNRKSILKIINRPVATTGISKGSWNRYKNRFLTQNKINLAVKFYKKHKGTLKKAKEKYGISPEYIVAIIGMESNFGKNVGTTPIIDALTTIAFGKTRRSAYFKQELEEFLIMCKNQGLDPRLVKGSYAGAMGYGQFMPNSIKKYAVDFNANGKKNMWDAADAIGSVANYFKANGWQANKTVAVPAAASSGKYKNIGYGWRHAYTLGQLESYDIKPKDNIRINSNKLYFIKLITYKEDELWIGGHNFYVITRYNNSSKYAMTVFLLANKIKNKI